MDVHETVLSDVHVRTKKSDKLGSFVLNCHPSTDRVEVYLSKLLFRRDEDCLIDDLTPKVDRDGDLEVKRNDERRWQSVLLEHSSSTPLSHVGLQVWNAGLLLADFILHQKNLWSGKTIVELGSGTGLCSILLAIYAKRVFCTDTGDIILQTCLRNVQRNRHLINGKIDVLQLDWFSNNSTDNSQFNDVSYIFASDVIYDEAITNAFFSTITKLMSKNERCVLYLSLEKRLNFTLSDFEIAAPAYNHFDEHLKFLSNENSKWSVSQIETNFPQYFQYSRTNYLELWQISFGQAKR